MEQVRKMITDEQIKKASDLVDQKQADVAVLMYDMQNFSTVDHHNADLRVWLAGMTADGYDSLIERLKRR
jgi:hypothetical protein